MNSAEESGVARVFMMLLPSGGPTMKKQKLKDTSKNEEENRSSSQASPTGNQPTSVFQSTIKKMDWACRLMDEDSAGKADFEEENDRKGSLPSNASRQRKGGDSTSRLVNCTERAFRPKSSEKIFKQ
jgi:hypothetical protein